MKTLLLLLTTTLLATGNATSATILLNQENMSPKKSPMMYVFGMKFYNIPESFKGEPFLLIIIEFDHLDTTVLGTLKNWQREMSRLCHQKGGIRNQKDHYDKLMPIVEEYCEKIKNLHPAQIKLSFPRVKEEVTLREVK